MQRLQWGSTRVIEGPADSMLGGCEGGNRCVGWMLEGWGGRLTLGGGTTGILHDSSQDGTWIWVAMVTQYGGGKTA